MNSDNKTIVDNLTEIEKMENGSKHSDQELTVIRYAEWQPQTLSADVTIEIPPFIHYIKENHLNDLNFHFWIEFSSYTVKESDLLSKKIDNLVYHALQVGKQTYKSFPLKINIINLENSLVQYKPKS